MGVSNGTEIGPNLPPHGHTVMTQLRELVGCSASDGRYTTTLGVRPLTCIIVTLMSVGRGRHDVTHQIQFWLCQLNITLQLPGSGHLVSSFQLTLRDKVNYRL